MVDSSVPCTCFACGKAFSYDPEKTNTFLPRYQIAVCHSCYRANHDGWRPDYGDKIELHLKTNNLPPVQRNAKGLMPHS
jgi:hypothetical protein